MTSDQSKGLQRGAEVVWTVKRKRLIGHVRKVHDVRCVHVKFKGKPLMAIDVNDCRQLELKK